MVASDLRLAIGSILIVREITKIAEYSRNIARYLDFFKPKAAQTEQLKTTFKFLIEMIDLIQALINHYDTDLSARVIQINKDITQDFQSAKKGMISKIREADSDDDAMILYSSLRQIKALEKAGDHIINIQEILTFIRNGSFDETPPED
jgi:phosphate transport system protein